MHFGIGHGLLCGAAFFGISNLARATTYNVINVPSVDPNGAVYAQGINSSGEITGYYETSQGNQFILLHYGFTAQANGSGVTNVQSIGYGGESQASYNAYANPPQDPNNGGFQSWGFAINGNGTVAGSITNNSGYDFGEYNSGAPIVDLTGVSDPASPNGYTEDFAAAISNNGVLAGSVWQASNTSRMHAFVYSPVGGYTDLSNGTKNTSGAYGINPAGTEVVGYLTTGILSSQNGGAAANVKQATVWTNNGSGWSAPTALAPLPGGTQSVAYAVNSSGLIVGISETSGAPDAVAWVNGTPIDLDGSGPGQSQYPLASPTDFSGTSISQLTQAGNIMNSAMFQEGFGIPSIADAVNDNGQIVGTMDGYAFLATLGPDNVPSVVNLNDLIPADSGWNLVEATGINDSGAIVGYGIYDQVEASFVLTVPSAVPEPMSMPLIAVAAIALLGRRNRISCQWSA